MAGGEFDQRITLERSTKVTARFPVQLQVTSLPPAGRRRARQTRVALCLLDCCKMAALLSFLWTLDTALGVGCAAAAAKNIFASSVPLAERAESVILSLILFLVAASVVFTACVPPHTNQRNRLPPPHGSRRPLCAQFSHSFFSGLSAWTLSLRAAALRGACGAAGYCS